MTTDLDPFSPAWREDPYPLYRRLRDTAPVHYVPSMNVHCVSRHADVQRVLKDDATFSSRAMFTVLMNGGREGLDFSWPGLKAIARMIFRLRMNPLHLAGRVLIASDGESHSGMRGIVNRGFTPRRIASLEPRVRSIVAECIQPLREGDPFDLIQDLAIPLPVTMIAEMLGIPIERQADFKRWSDVIIDNSTGPGRADPFNDGFLSTMEEVFHYFLGEIKQRRSQPSPGDDLIGELLTSQEGDAKPLNAVELVQFVMLLLVAGNETTTNLIGNGTRALLDHRDQLSEVARDPSLVPALIEETLRYDAPIQVIFRNALAPVEIAGTQIPKGATVATLLGSANRDERQFENPDRFDLHRDARGHLGFGFGRHFCLGASLARLEAGAAFDALIPELTQVSEPEGKSEHLDSFLVRGPARLPIQIQA